MANTLDPMDIKQVFSLHADGLSNRKIADILGLSRNTINQYIGWLKASDYTAKELIGMEDGLVRELFPSRTTIKNKRYDALMCHFEQIRKAQKYPGFTFLHHYTAYSEAVDDPYSYTQFMEHFNRKYKKEKGSMKLDHIPGNEVYIDFAGKKLSIVNKETGESEALEVFIAILPYSQYTYVEACRSQKRADLIHCMNNMLSFYGGVPKAIVSDNLKSAVSRSSKYEAEINRSFKDFALHYGCATNPTRAYRPQDKALVENAVQLTYQRIYHPLREITFFSLEELNTELHKLLAIFNNMLFQRKEASRKELYQSIERASLKPLATQRYELKEYARAKVQKMGYVYFSADKNYYSVPYRYIGQSTTIHYTQKIVEVYYGHERIAIHQRSDLKGRYNTIKDHLSSTHQQYKDWSPEHFKQRAGNYGQDVEACVNTLFLDREYPETAYKSALGLFKLGQLYGNERLNNACKRAIMGDAVSYYHIQNILKNSLDKCVEDPLSNNQTHIPVHENIRGKESYQ